MRRIFSATLFGIVSSKLKNLESSYRIESPISILIAHLFGFIFPLILMFIFPKILTGMLAALNISSIHHCACPHHGFPKLSLLSTFLFLIKFMLEFISKVIWFQPQVSKHRTIGCKHVDINYYAERYIEPATLSLLISMIIISVGSSKLLSFLSIIQSSIIAYSLYLIWRKRLMIRTKNYKKIFISSLLQNLILLIILAYDVTSSCKKMSSLYRYLSLLLVLSVSGGQVIEILSCFYLVLDNYRYNLSLGVPLNLPSSKELISTTLVVGVTHLFEHLSPIIFLHNPIYASVVSLIETYVLLFDTFNPTDWIKKNLKLPFIK